ncbi:MAG TPA: beta-ketoacyl synthase N-terminal-like domain-containing protein [Victivallales bacterium]|nr:beta-ketoacyl synthase N-terminal-like domain-containing protein [Victivallales bacterium]
MTSNKVVITDADINTGYGFGIDLCWNQLLLNKTSILKNTRFITKNFISDYAALVPNIYPNKNESCIMQMLTPLFDKIIGNLPNDTLLILATTTGEIELLEQSILEKNRNIEESGINSLLHKIQSALKLKEDALIISAACASSSTAIAQAASMIKNGVKDSILIIGCDTVSEFVYSGFSALQALGKEPAKPFDQNRDGLTLGDGAGYALLMSESKANKENRNFLGYVSGWGLSNDSNHITGPSRDGYCLVAAIEASLITANISSAEIGSISAHGTGTLYNDSMEIKAFKSMFKTPIPTYSLKGGTGHTLGAAGLIEALICLKSLEENIIPPSVGIKNIAEDAKKWINTKSHDSSMQYSLSTNSGFGGINASLVLSKIGNPL